MIKVLIMQGNLFDDSTPIIKYTFPDIESAIPHIEEAIRQECWACITEDDDEG